MNNDIADFIAADKSTFCGLEGFSSEEDFTGLFNSCASKMQVAMPYDGKIVVSLNKDSLKEIGDFCGTLPSNGRKLLFVDIHGARDDIVLALMNVVEYCVSNAPYIKFVVFHQPFVKGVVTGTSIKAYSIFGSIISESASNPENKTRVLKALASASLRERKFLIDTVKEWTSEDSELLKCWAQEKLSKRYNIFHKDEVESLGFEDKFAYNLIGALDSLSSSSPKIAAYSIFNAYLGQQ